MRIVRRELHSVYAGAARVMAACLLAGAFGLLSQAWACADGASDQTLSTPLATPQAPAISLEELAAGEFPSIAMGASEMRSAHRQVGAISPFPLHLRLGAEVSPRLKVAGGVDMTLSGLHILSGFNTRVTAEAIVSANFGGVSTLVPITIDELYSHGLLAGTSIYGGIGIGPYIGGTTRFGGKVFLGGMFTSRLGAEAAVHFPGWGDPLLVLEARLGI